MVARMENPESSGELEGGLEGGGRRREERQRRMVVAAGGGWVGNSGAIAREQWDGRAREGELPRAAILSGGTVTVG